MSDFEWQKMQQEQEQREMDELADMLESEAEIISEEHPDLEEILGKLEYREDR